MGNATAGPLVRVLLLASSQRRPRRANNRPDRLDRILDKAASLAGRPFHWAAARGEAELAGNAPVNQLLLPSGTRCASQQRGFRSNFDPFLYDSSIGSNAVGSVKRFEQPRRRERKNEGERIDLALSAG